MIYYKIEGLNTLNGLNIYKPSDPNSAGFVIQLGKWKFCIRYSKRVKRWFVWLKKEYYGNR
jgi:hypothetical protein